MSEDPDASLVDQEVSRERFAQFRKPTHYYGDIVRVIFVCAGVALIIIPVFLTDVDVSMPLVILSALVLGFLAGITNPRQRWIATANSIVSAVGIILFESAAIGTYQSFGVTFSFLVWQALALAFFFALYFSVKTIRGFLVR